MSKRAKALEAENASLREQLAAVEWAKKYLVRELIAARAMGGELLTEIKIRIPVYVVNEK